MLFMSPAEFSLYKHLNNAIKNILIQNRESTN